MYDRMSLEQRKQTMIYTEIHVEVVDFDGRVFKVQFEAEEDYGIAAHAVYAEHYKDVERLDEQADALVKCLFDVYANRNVLSSAQDASTHGGHPDWCIATINSAQSSLHKPFAICSASCTPDGRTGTNLAQR